MKAVQRSRRVVPKWLLMLLVGSFLLHVFLYFLQPVPIASAQDLPSPSSLAVLKIASLGEPLALSKLLMLWLQAHDNQPGISIPFRELDYARVEQWLERILVLDERGQYPLLAASRLYAEVPDPNKQRQMLDFVARKFHYDPARRWPWLAHGVILAKHRLKDLDLALKYAEALADTEHNDSIPSWAQQMEFIILEDMGELESARIVIGGLLASQAVTDPHEIHFLKERLSKLEARLPSRD